ncbi:MAG: hypothetical protein Q8P86_00335 [bacterium]|nr:hypothetical protein [bacterium]
MNESINNESMNMGSKKPGRGLLWLVVVIILAVAVAAFFYYYRPSQDAEMADEDRLAPELRLTEEEKSGDVASDKAEILAIVRSGRPLSADESQRISGIMFAKAHIYNFSSEEREEIFSALTNSASQ